MKIRQLLETKQMRTDRLLRGVLENKIARLRPLADSNPAAAAEITEYETRLKEGKLCQT